MGTGFFQDDKGNDSSTRLIKVMIFGTLCLAYLVVTVASIVRDGAVKMVDIPGGVIAFAGLTWAGNEIHKAIENKGATPPSPPVA
ncbi:MAG: hypothetical protein M0T69_02200 [Deltaproteobacteria bacterium]|nr:hypothetical protein [Deltaproteobacteria bacterium]